MKYLVVSQNGQVLPAPKVNESNYQLPISVEKKLQISDTILQSKICNLQFEINTDRRNSWVLGDREQKPATRGIAARKD